MNSHLKSVGNNFLLLLIGLVFAACGCVMNPTKDTLSRSSDSNLDDAKEELSLKKDSDEIAALRKNVPESKREENNDLRDILTTLGEVKRPPSDHREKFENQMRKIRERQRLARQKERDTYNKEERKSREAFLKNLKTERDSFMRTKADRDTKKEFFEKQDDARKTYFEDERDKRRDFDSDMRQKESDQTALYREKSEEFYKELKIYTTKYNELQKAARERERARESGGRSGAGAASGTSPGAGATPATGFVPAKEVPNDELKYLNPNAAPSDDPNTK